MVSLRSLLVRRLLGALRTDEDVVARLSRFQRVGENLDGGEPSHALPVGTRAVLQGVRTQAATQIRPDWVWPYWIERQLDPRAPSFVPQGHLPFTTNVTHRNWTTVGNADSSKEAIVDPSGLVTPWLDGWSLDWWVDPGTGWQFPSRHTGIRQRLVENAPVVETTMPVSSAECVQRVYAVSEEEEFVVAEVQNRTRDRVEVAFALRPYNPEGLAVVEQVELQGHTLMVDGRPAVFLPEAPTRFVVSSFLQGDTAGLVDKGRMELEAGRGRDRAGLAQVALVYEVAAGQTIRVAMPFEPKRRRFRRLRRLRASHIPTPDVVGLESARSIAEQWTNRLQKEGMRVELPDSKLQSAIDANRAYLLLFHDGRDVKAGPFTYPRFRFRDAAYQVSALDRWGFHREAEEVLRSYPERQRRDGLYDGQPNEWDSVGAAIWTIAEHYRVTGDREFAEAMVPSVRRASQWLAKTLHRRRRAGPGLDGLLPAGVSAEHLGPFDHYYWDNFWAVRALQDAGQMLRLVQDEEGAAECDRVRAVLRTALFESVERAALRIGRRVIAAGPGRGMDAGMIGSLVCVWPLHLLAPSNPWVVVTMNAIREEFLVGDAIYQGVAHTGLGTYLTLQLGFAELEAGDPRAWDRFRWLLDASTPTFTWPEAIHPALGTGCMGDGHHGWASADFLSFARNVLVRDTREGGVALLTLLPAEWEGHDVRVHDAPTHHGRVSFELSWLDENPLLSWECDREGVRLTAPGLDPRWSTTERAGEAKLAPGGLVQTGSIPSFGAGRRRRRRTLWLAP